MLEESDAFLGIKIWMPSRTSATLMGLPEASTRLISTKSPKMPATKLSTCCLSTKADTADMFLVPLPLKRLKPLPGKLMSALRPLLSAPLKPNDTMSVSLNILLSTFFAKMPLS